MDCTKCGAPLPRQKLLQVIHADQYFETFGQHVDVCVVRVPAAFSREAEIMAEDVVELLIPLRFRSLYRRDKLISNGTTAPLYPTTLQRAIGTRESIRRLNAVMEVDE